MYIFDRIVVLRAAVGGRQSVDSMMSSGAGGPAAPPPVSREAIAALQGQPQFEEAVRRSARFFIALHQGERLAGWILGDRARALFGFILLNLHATARGDDPRSGLTVSRVKETCVAVGLCSAGRAGAMLSLLRAAGYVATMPSAEDARVRRLVPTHKLLDMVRHRIKGHFECVGPLVPAAAASLPLMGRDDFVYAMVQALNDFFIAGFRILHHVPELGLFAERSAATVMLFDLLLAGENGDSFPPQTPVPFSISDLARRFRVSRTHVLRLFRKAEESGLLARVGARGEAVQLSPELGQAALDLLTTSILFLAAGADVALAEFDRREQRALS